MSRRAQTPLRRGRSARVGRQRLVHVDKPWGWELWWAYTERYVGKILHINRGAALSYQFHRQKDETIYVLRGELALDLAPGGRRRRRHVLRRGDGLRIHPGDHHRMTALTACDVLEASTPEVEDVVRLEDRYGRAGGGAAASEKPAHSGPPVAQVARRLRARGGRT